RARRLGAQPIRPLGEHRARRLEEARELLLAQLIAPPHRRELRAVQDLVRVRVADPAEQALIRERALERVPLARDRVREAREVRLERLRAAAVELRERRLAAHEVERRALLLARL